MISSFEFPQLWEANSDIQLLIAMHEMDLAVLWQTSNLQELITGFVLLFGNSCSPKKGWKCPSLRENIAKGTTDPGVDYFDQ